MKASSIYAHFLTIFDRTNYYYSHCAQLHVCWTILLLLLYGPQVTTYYLYAYYTVKSGIKQLNWIEKRVEMQGEGVMVYEKKAQMKDTRHMGNLGVVVWPRNNGRT